MSNHWMHRENKYNAKRKRMPKHGRSLFVIEEITRKRAEKARAIKARENQNNKQGDSQQGDGTIDIILERGKLLSKDKTSCLLRITH